MAIENHNDATYTGGYVCMPMTRTQAVPNHQCQTGKWKGAHIFLGQQHFESRSVCPAMSLLNLHGHEMKMPRPLMVNKQNYIHFIFLIYFKYEMKPASSKFCFFKIYTRIIVKNCEIETESAPPNIPWNLNTDLNSKLCWP